MPYVDERSLKMLIDGYQAQKVATCFQNPENKLPEPLLAIYSPQAVEKLTGFLQEGKTCLRKFLITHDTHQLAPHNATVVANWNEPQDVKVGGA
jgi:molybdopterin-guanine dinucleotide biosynthesis protein A